MPDQPLTRDGPVSVPQDYIVPNGGELIPLTVRATLDGTSAASPFYGVVQVVSPSGRVMFSAISASIAAGGSADVTWFPGVDVDETTSLADFSGAALALGPWAFWRINEAAGASNVIDYSGHGRTIHPDNSVTLGVSPGLVPSESWTTSSSPQIAVSNQYNFRSNSNQTFASSTATCVAYLEQVGNGGHEMDFSCMGTIGAPTSFLWRTYLTGGGQVAVEYQGTDTASHSVTFAAAPTLGADAQVAVRIDGTHLSCFINGVLADQQAQPIAMLGTLTAEVFVGQPLGGAGVRWYAGEMGPVIWYDK